MTPARLPCRPIAASKASPQSGRAREIAASRSGCNLRVLAHKSRRCCELTPSNSHASAARPSAGSSYHSYAEIGLCLLPEVRPRLFELSSRSYHQPAPVARARPRPAALPTPADSTAPPPRALDAHRAAQSPLEPLHLPCKTEIPRSCTPNSAARRSHRRKSPPETSPETPAHWAARSTLSPATQHPRTVAFLPTETPAPSIAHAST